MYVKYKFRLIKMWITAILSVYRNSNPAQNTVYPLPQNVQFHINFLLQFCITQYKVQFQCWHRGCGEKFAKETQYYTNMELVYTVKEYFSFNISGCIFFITYALHLWIQIPSPCVFSPNFSNSVLLTFTKPMSCYLWLDEAKMSHPQCCGKLQLTVNPSVPQKQDSGWLICYETPTEKQMLTAYNWHPPVKTDSQSHTNNLAHLLGNIWNDDFITVQTLAQLV